MKIGFLLGWPEISGGSYVIYEHASRLKRSGHEVAIITKEHVASDRYTWHPVADILDWMTLTAAEKKQFDIVIATWWESPFFLHQLTASYYVYFVQSIESRFWAEPDAKNHATQGNDLGKLLCESTYSYNIPIITEAEWIKDYLFTHYNHQAYLVRNGIRKDIYTSEGHVVSQRIGKGVRVLVEGPVDVAYKNVPTTVELCRQAGVEEVWLLTSSKIDDFSGVDRVFSCIPVHETPSIYRSCDVLVKLSYIEGMFGPPLEMFHCGGTAIVYDVTGHDEYIVHGQNSYVVAKDENDQVVSCLQRLQNDPDELDRLKAGATATAAKWYDWENSSQEFEQSLKRISQGSIISRAYLKEQTETLFANHQLRTAAREMEVFTQRAEEKIDSASAVDNFVQFYWHSGEGWSQDRCQWIHYSCGDLVTASFVLDVGITPIHLRIDPSVHIGVIELHSIRVAVCDSKEEIFLCDNAKDLSRIDIQGTFYLLHSGKNMLFFSYGDDPQFVLPFCEKVESKACIEVTIVFREMGVRQFLAEQCRNGFPGKKGLFAKMLNRLS